MHEVPKGKGATKTVSGCLRHSTSPFGTISPTCSCLIVALDLFHDLIGVLDSENAFHLLLDLEHHAVVVFQEHLRVLTSLSDALAVIAVPRARLLDDPRFGTNVHEQRRVADPFGVHDVELGLLERRRDLVLHDLHANVRADDVFLFLDRSNAANVETNGRVELERLSTRGRLRVAEHDTDLLAQLVNEHDRRLRARDRTRELSQRLTHEARLQTDVRVAHLSLDLGLRYECGNGVDHHDVHCPRAHEN